MRKLRPLTVLGPDPTAVFFGEDYFNHRDHRTIGFAVARRPVAGRRPARTTSPTPGAATRCETALLSGTLEPTVWVDVTATIDDKAAAVSCHRSQFADGRRMGAAAPCARRCPRGRAPGRGGFAEGFRRLRLSG